MFTQSRSGGGAQGGGWTAGVGRVMRDWRDKQRATRNPRIDCCCVSSAACPTGRLEFCPRLARHAGTSPQSGLGLGPRRSLVPSTGQTGRLPTFPLTRPCTHSSPKKGGPNTHPSLLSPTDARSSPTPARLVLHKACGCNPPFRGRCMGAGPTAPRPGAGRAARRGATHATDPIRGEVAAAARPGTRQSRGRACGA